MERSMGRVKRYFEREKKKPFVSPKRVPDGAISAFTGFSPQPPSSTPSPPKTTRTSGLGIRTRNAAAAAALREPSKPGTARYGSPSILTFASNPSFSPPRPPSSQYNRASNHAMRMSIENARDSTPSLPDRNRPEASPRTQPSFSQTPDKPQNKILGPNKPTAPASLLQLSPQPPTAPQPGQENKIFRRLRIAQPLPTRDRYATPSPPPMPPPTSLGPSVSRSQVVQSTRDVQRPAYQQIPAVPAAPTMGIRHTSNTVVRVTKDQQLVHQSLQKVTVNTKPRVSIHESMNDARLNRIAPAPPPAPPSHPEAQSVQDTSLRVQQQNQQQPVHRRPSSVRFHDQMPPGDASAAPVNGRAAEKEPPSRHGSQSARESMIAPFQVASRASSVGSVATTQYTPYGTIGHSARSDYSDTSEFTVLPGLEDSAIEALDHLSGYAVGEVIGEGGFCQVKIGRHEPSGQQVAIKVIDKEALKQPHDWRRVGREVRILKRLKNHPAIIHLYDVIPLPSKVLLVQELAQGGSLLDCVRGQKRLTEEKAIGFFLQIVAGLQYCHRNEVVHRDIKLENLLMDTNQNMKIIDFGLAAIFTPGKLLKVHCGSPSYAAPEIVGRQLYEGPPADVWSLGVVTFAMVCGYLPFHSRNGRAELSQKIMSGRFAIPEWMSDPMRDIVTRMLSVDPSKRLQFSQVWTHPWITGSLAHASFSLPAVLLQTDPKTGEYIFSPEITHHMTLMGADAATLLQDLKQKECNLLTATYFLLAEALAARGRLPAVSNPKAFVAHQAARRALSSSSARGFSLDINDEGDRDDCSHFAPVSGHR